MRIFAKDAFYGIFSMRFFVVQSKQLIKASYNLPYTLVSSVGLFPFSTLDNQLDNHGFPTITKNRSDIDEGTVLSELSDLFPVNSEKKIGKIKEIDGLLLLPEERLRGVFLQKLSGKAAIERALSNVGIELNVDVFAKVVNWSNLDGEKMVRFFNWATKDPKVLKDINTYNILLKALGRRKFHSYMVEILNDMKSESLSPNLETLSIVTHGLLKARRVSNAIKMFRHFGDIGLDCNTESLNVVLDCFFRGSHFSAASSFLKSMKGKIKFDTATYNAVMKGWSRLGRVGELEKLLEVMVVDGVDRDGSTYGCLIEGLGRAGWIADGVRIFESLNERILVLDTSAYNAMISNFVSVRNLDESLKYYRSMLSSNCEPNIDTYTRLIGGLLEVRKVADALELFDEMLNRGIIPSTRVVTSFIRPLCGYAPPHAAMMVYKKAKGVGCTISLSAYRLLLMRLSRFGKCEMLFSMWSEMQDCGYSPDVKIYEYVIDGLCNVGQLENAVLVMEECLRKGFCPFWRARKNLINKLCDTNRVEIAYKLFLKIKKACRDENARRYWHSKGWHF